MQPRARYGQSHDANTGRIREIRPKRHQIMGHKAFRSQPTLSRSFPADRSAPGAARQAVDQVASGIPAHLRDDIRLLVSEVVTNSVIHGHSEADAEVELEVWTTGDTVRVAVKDSGPGFEPSQARPRREHSGWGLMMVDQLADRWGVDRDGHTQVWFELRRARAEGRTGAGRDGAVLVR